MKKILTVTSLGLCLLFALPTVKAAVAAEGDMTVTSRKAARHKKGKERHAAVHAALHKLEKARQDLEKAAHNYGGHRVKAIQDIDLAIQELRAALKFEKI